MLPAAAVADPVGKFTVRGINPDNGGEYGGTVRVTRTGETYKVVWNTGGDPLTGIGVGLKMVDGRIVMGPASEDDVGISIAYATGGTVGTVIYFEQPDGHWHGIWAYDGWDHISTEDWFAKDRKKIAKTETKVDKETRSLEQHKAVTSPMPDQAGPKS
jgi:hypothetical protein